MEAVKRIRRSESMWREILARRAASELTEGDFCRAEGIHRTMLGRWRTKLAKTEKRKPVIRPVAKVASPFIDVGNLAVNRSALEVRLDFGGGLVLSIARG
jgi:hypothetical protein